MTRDVLLADAAIRSALSLPPALAPTATISAISASVRATRQRRARWIGLEQGAPWRGWAAEDRLRWARLAMVAALVAASLVSLLLIANQNPEPWPPRNGEIVVVYGNNIYVAERGQPPRVIAASDTEIRFSTWSDEGRWLAWWANIGSNEHPIWTIKVASAGDLIGTSIAGGRTFVPGSQRISWAPDSHAFVFDESVAGVHRLRIWDRATDSITELAPEEAGDIASWSPTGSMIAFRSPASSQLDVRLLGVDPGSGTTHLIAADLDDGFSPLSDYGAISWTSDGSRLAFDAVRNPSQFRVYSVNPDGSELREHGKGLNSAVPLISQDGRWVEFQGWAADRPDAYVASTVPDAVPILLSRNAITESWSPDGTEFLVTEFRPSDVIDTDCIKAVVAYSVDGTQRRTVVSHVDLAVDPSLPCLGPDVAWRPIR